MFGLCWQHSKDDKWDNLDEYLDDPRFKIVDVDFKESKGACWARNSLQQQYDGEQYTFQLDSHHRFIEGWDTELINMLEGLIEKGHKKPLITSYISSYNPENDPEGRVNVPWLMNFDRFIPEGAIFFLPATIPNWETLTEPVPTRFYSAHFRIQLLYLEGQRENISVLSLNFNEQTLSNYINSYVMALLLCFHTS